MLTITVTVSTVLRRAFPKMASLGLLEPWDNTEMTMGIGSLSTEYTGMVWGLGFRVWMVWGNV